MTSTSMQLHLDLDNFEEPPFEECKYVLTSPRSLEACTRIGVKPVDLLYKALAEFQEEMLPQDIALRTIYNIYDDREQERQRKLALCKLERRKIMSEPHRSVDITNDDLNKASIQRRRTAWASCVGHERISTYEVNQRSNELHDESMKLREELLSKKEKKQPIKKKTKKSGKGLNISKLSASTTSVLNRSSLSEAKPIISTKVKRALKGSLCAKNCPLTLKDQKILELIVSKGEEEKVQQKERHLVEMEWSQQRRQEDAARKELEHRRRRMLADEARIRQMKLNKRDNQKKKVEESLLEEKAKLLELSHKQWHLRTQQQQIMQELKMVEKRDGSSLRKKSQEQNLKERQEDEVNIHQAMTRKFMSDMRSAEQRKDIKILRDSMKSMVANRNERNAFEERWKAVQKDSEDMINSMESFVESKHCKSQAKYKRIHHMKQKEMEINKLEREKKQLEARLRQKQMDDEMDKWRDTVIVNQKFAEEKAYAVMSQVIEDKARIAHVNRITKDMEQKKNIKKIHKEVEARRRETQQEVERKDRKSSSVKQEKDQVLQQSRFLAHTSQTFREVLKQRYGSDSFDKKVQMAELFNRIGSGPVSALRNSSSITFS